MDIEIDLTNIEKGLSDLFKFAFTTNCTLDSESITTEESKTLAELDSSEVLENFKDLVLNLLKFKKEYKTSDKAELAQRSEQFETLLQKLEAEVRSHIRVEHQLKLHIENNQNRIDELEKIEARDKNTIKELEDKCNLKRPGKINETERIKKEMDEKVKNLLEVIEKKEKILHKVEYENVKLRNLLEEKARECENLKKELIKASKATPRNKELMGSNSIDYLKRKIEASRALQRAKEKSPCSIRESAKGDRKSLGETEFSKLAASPYLRKDHGCIKKDDLKSSSKAILRGHMRSISDQKLLSSKRSPSR